MLDLSSSFQPFRESPSYKLINSDIFPTSSNNNFPHDLFCLRISFRFRTWFCVRAVLIKAAHVVA